MNNDHSSDMPEMPEFDLDRSVAFAWASFQRRLADHVAAMLDNDVLLLETGFDTEPQAPGVLPCVQFLVWDGNIVRCEVPSNAFLDRTRALSRSDERKLLDLGWNPPTPSPGEDAPRESVVNGSPAFHVDHHRSWSAHLAAMAVSAFRDVWGVTHPSFLRSEGRGSTFVVREAEVLPSLDPSLAVEPLDHDHLHDLVTRTLIPALGLLPERDSDGDVPIRVGSAIMFVGPLAGTVDIQVFAPLVHTISDRTRAAEVTADLNRRWSRIKFLLLDDRLTALLVVSGNPFVPRHLTDAVEMFSTFLETVDASLAHRLGGTPYFLHEDAREAPGRSRLRATDLPDELTELFRVDPGCSGALDGAAVAAICGGDRDRILQVLQIGNEWVAQHRRDASEASARGDEFEAEAIDSLGDAWENVVSNLRTALRLVAPRPDTSGELPRGEQPGLFSSPGEPTLFDDPSP
ncbi:hypothetical protein SAMN05444695_10974 [Rhodococcus triatomae]|uniref:YbjN domain-containing protein n=1 Tax=Rhodococcus triatomae TaxID=300028 RepID=A0A1G8M1I5_9NOCA|nr:hypothetical protein [Rhodococcus triatomae]SDI61637.1 hypothetical protein SAMN05444695_10974 [Rhodococcus triatomae]